MDGFLASLDFIVLLFAGVALASVVIILDARRDRKPMSER